MVAQKASKRKVSKTSRTISMVKGGGLPLRHGTL